MQAVQPCQVLSQCHILAFPPHTHCSCPRLARRHCTPCNCYAYDLRCAILPSCNLPLSACHEHHSSTSESCQAACACLTPLCCPLLTTRPSMRPLANLPAAYQIFAQPMFDTVESHIKAFIIKREKKRAGLNATNTVGAGATSKAAATLTATASASAGSASKLDAPNSHPYHHHQPSPFDAITEPSVGVQELASNDMDKMEEGGLVVQNSAPLPDLVPEKGTLVWRRSRSCSLVSGAGSWELGAERTAGASAMPARHRDIHPRLLPPLTALHAQAGYPPTSASDSMTMQARLT